MDSSILLAWDESKGHEGGRRRGGRNEHQIDWTSSAPAVQQSLQVTIRPFRFPFSFVPADRKGANIVYPAPVYRPTTARRAPYTLTPDLRSAPLHHHWPSRSQISDQYSPPSTTSWQQALQQAATVMPQPPAEAKPTLVLAPLVNPSSIGSYALSLPIPQLNRCKLSGHLLTSFCVSLIKLLPLPAPCQRHKQSSRRTLLVIGQREDSGVASMPLVMVRAYVFQSNLISLSISIHRVPFSLVAQGSELRGYVSATLPAICLPVAGFVGEKTSPISFLLLQGRQTAIPFIKFFLPALE
jgi:hypothetical protein